MSTDSWPYDTDDERPMMVFTSTDDDESLQDKLGMKLEAPFFVVLLLLQPSLSVSSWGVPKDKSRLDNIGKKVRPL